MKFLDLAGVQQLWNAADDRLTRLENAGASVAIFHVDMSDATDDPENPGGKNQGVYAADPGLTEAKLMEAVNAGKQVILYIEGFDSMPIPVLLTHRTEGGNNNMFGGIQYMVEYPQRILHALDIYIVQRTGGLYVGMAYSTFANSVAAVVDQTYDATSANAQSGVAVAEVAGDLSALTTTAQTDLVSAVNEVKFAVDGLGEPFRVKQWASNTLNVEIPYCTEDVGNTNIPKMVFTIDDVEGAEYQIVGMISYELFDAASGGNRINAWPVCQFTGNGQKELGVRWMCGGTTRKVAKRISAWVLLKHR